MAATLLLAVVSAAEAGIIAISRSRVRNGNHNGSGALLLSYIRHRHALLAALAAADTATTVTGTAALALVVLKGREATPLSVAVIALGALIVISLVRQTARALATQNPEAVGVALAAPTRWLQLIFTPLSWLTSLPAQLLLRALGRPSGEDAPNAADELVAILEAPDESNATLVEERRMMRGVLDLSEQTVREIMSPRTDITAVSMDASIGDVLRIVNDSGFSRIPLYEGDIDHIVGVIYAKDLLAYLLTGAVQPRLADIARPPYFVPETKRANELLTELRRDKVHLAIAIDEYGGTAGVVTVEDLVEEIVGEIADEYDLTGDVEVQQIADDAFLVDARLGLGELIEILGIEVEREDVDTVGGLVVALLGRLAVPGDEVVDSEHGLHLRVLSVVGRRIKRVRIERLSPVREAAGAE